MHFKSASHLLSSVSKNRHLHQRENPTSITLSGFLSHTLQGDTYFFGARITLWGQYSISLDQLLPFFRDKIRDLTELLLQKYVFRVIPKARQRLKHWFPDTNDSVFPLLAE